MLYLQTANSLTPTSPSLPTSVSAAIVLGYALDTLKRLQQFPKINYYSTKLNTWIRLAMTGLATVGVSWTWSSTTNGGHQWIWNLPAWTVLLIGIWHWATQYGMQQIFEIGLAARPIAQKAMTTQVLQQGV